MQSPCIREASKACCHGCCPTPSLGLPEPPSQNSKSKNKNSTPRLTFSTSTASSLLPNTPFTNHESLPSLTEAFSHFTKAYPQFTQTNQADRIRALEYTHLSLSSHVCLDYTGVGLFSHSQKEAHLSSSSSSADFPFFDISNKSVSLNSLIQYGSHESEFESAIKKRIMGSLNISESDYCMVFTANRASAFKLLADSYPFKSNKKLLTVYDYKSEAVGRMIDNSQKRGAKIMSSDFSWPGMRIQSTKLKKMIESKSKKRKQGLFVFPLQSRMTGTRYSYLWMKMAQENGWHVLLDACALGPKDMDTLGLSLFLPDFLICSFFKIFGEDPSGFGCLFVKKSIASELEDSPMNRSLGIISLISANKLSQFPGYSSGSNSDTQQKSRIELQEDDSLEISSSSKREIKEFEHGETSELRETEDTMKQKELFSSEIEELENPFSSVQQKNTEISTEEIEKNSKIECKGLDHADSLGLILISCRARYLINWLVNALTKLRHPNSEKGRPLVKIYGPKVKFDRGPAMAFNVFDWKGEKVEPVLVQKLADRSNISLSYGFLHNIWFSDQYQEEKERVLERTHEETEMVGNKRKDKVDLGINVVTASLSFLADFEDGYRLWAFIAQFLDADFVEKERWRYTALNQKTIEV